MTTPNPNRVTLRWLALEGIDDSRWPALWDVLDEGERERAARFHFERDRQAYIAAHALTRAVLSQRGDRPPNTWRFTLGAHGKPAVDDGSLCFNLSHTRGFVAVAVAVAPSVELGIDTERIDPKRLAPDLAERVFAPAECDHLRGLKDAARTVAAHTFWTLKESYIKAIGLGLACPLDAFRFELDPPRIAFTDRLNDDPARWLFKLWRPTPDHVLALAARHDAPDSLEIDARAADDDELPR